MFASSEANAYPFGFFIVPGDLQILDYDLN